MIYLAAPYSHKSKAVEAQRAKLTTILSHNLLQRGLANISPITLGRGYLEAIPTIGTTAKDFELLNIQLLNMCSRLFVFCLPGWENSKGVNQEIQHYINRYPNGDIVYIQPHMTIDAVIAMMNQQRFNFTEITNANSC